MRHASGTRARNVGLGTDYTIYSLVDGVVQFEHKNKKRLKVSVVPVEYEIEIEAIDELLRRCRRRPDRSARFRVCPRPPFLVNGGRWRIGPYVVRPRPASRRAQLRAPVAVGVRTLSPTE